VKRKGCDRKGGGVRIGSLARSLPSRCQTKLVCGVRAGLFCGDSDARNEREVEANEPVLTANAGLVAGRSLAAYCGVLGDMRSIAPILRVMVGRSLATIGVLFLRARTSRS
jgi:hypothetical protein